MEHQQWAVRSLALSDQPAVSLICRDVYGGLDQTPILFPKMLDKAGTCTHAVVDAATDEILGFQFIDILDEGRCAWLHSLRVRIGSASRFGR